MQEPNKPYKQGGRYRSPPDKKQKLIRHAQRRVLKNERSNESDHGFEIEKVVKLMAFRSDRLGSAEANITQKSWKKLECSYDGMEELELRYS